MHGSLLRRYGPLAAVIVVQLLIIAIAPSTARVGGPDAGGLGAFGGSGPGGAQGGDGLAGGPGDGPSATAGTGQAGQDGGARGGGTDQGGQGARQAKLEDTSHCVDGRQFDPAIDFYAPPCVPGKPGGSYPGDNGGQTSMGVSADSIEVVHYYTHYSPQVEALLRAQGIYRSPSQVKAFLRAVENFINSHYQLYGRKLNIRVHEGTCNTTPPDYPCLIAEMNRIAKKYTPYGFVWVTTICSACYAEMSRNGVVNLGGLGFSDHYSQANAPYHYDLAQSGSQVALAFTDWWCNQMSSVGTSRRVRFAAHHNPAQDFNGQPRELGVVTPNDRANKYVVEEVLKPALQRQCGEEVTHQYYYAQNPNTAAQQTEAATAAMNTPNNPATSVVCLCDPVAPAFGFGSYQEHNYWPEAILAASQGMGLDMVGQSYMDDNGEPTLACPNPRQGCEFTGALGIVATDRPVPLNDDAGTRVWRLGGGEGNTPWNSESATTVWEYYNMMASLIQATGPNLTPERMAQARLTLEPRGGGKTGHQLFRFVDGDWTWISDNRVVWWDPDRESRNNGEPGTYVMIEGRRFLPGEYPELRQPPAPPYDQRE